MLCTLVYLTTRPYFLIHFILTSSMKIQFLSFFSPPGVVHTILTDRLARRCARENTLLGHVNKLSNLPFLPNPIKDLQLVVKLHMQLIMHIILQTFTHDEVSLCVESAKFWCWTGTEAINFCWFFTWNVAGIFLTTANIFLHYWTWLIWDHSGCDEAGTLSQALGHCEQ